MSQILLATQMLTAPIHTWSTYVKQGVWSILDVKIFVQRQNATLLHKIV